MARKRKQNPDQPDLLDARVATAPCVPGIRAKVKAWRERGCKGVSVTTSILLLYARRVAQDVKLPSQFAALAPKVREFLETKAFGEQVALDEPTMIKAISSNVAQYVTVKTFVEALRQLVVAELEPQLLHPGRLLSETPPFPWSRATMEAGKSIFNLVPCDNEYEKEFARFLQKAEDVQRFAKLPEQFGFAIEYTDSVGNLRYYEPDFVVLTNDGAHYLVETKGLEDTNVANKDRAPNCGAKIRRSWRASLGHM